MPFFSDFDPVHAFNVAWARWRLRRALEARSDRALADMGMTRRDIAAVARVAFPPVSAAVTRPLHRFVLRSDAA